MSGQLSLMLPQAEPQDTARVLDEGVALLPRFAIRYESRVLTELAAVLAASPFRHMLTPGGFRMSVAMSNCGALGWVSDTRGYRYDALDPEHARPWPAMPASFRELASQAAHLARFEAFEPDACLINRYEPGSRLTLHQDKNERDFAAPIVAVSLGLPAVFLLGGLTRTSRPQRIALDHGDVVVWGGPARLRYHGVAPIKDGQHPTLGACRVNLTFRKAG